MAKIRTRLLQKHVRGCYGVQATRRGDWLTPWALFNKVEYRDSLGRKQAKGINHHRWHVLICNDPDCKATMLVNEEDLINAALDTQAG